MRTFHSIFLAGLVLSSTQTAQTAHAQILTQTPTQVSLSTTGGAPDGPSYLPVAGANGEGFVFESFASNLVANDTNGRNDVFFRSKQTNQIVRASVSTSGAEGDASSSAPSMSLTLANGFYAIAFESRASSFGSIPNPSALRNIYVRFPTLGITEIASPALGFTLPDGDSSEPSVAAVTEDDGKNKILIAFSSVATNLVAGDINGFSDIFLATLTPPSSTSYSPATLTTLTRITNSAIAGEEINGHSFFPQISSDGRYIIFCSRARNLVSPAIINLNENSQVFRYDIQTGETILVSKTTAGLPGDSDSYYPRISYTGRYAAYFSFATNIVGSETTRPNFPFIVRYDAVTDTTQQVNLAADGTSSGLGQLNSLGITANGRLITFGDVSNALVPDDTNGQGDIFVKDMENGQIARLSTGPGGVQSNGTSFNPTLTATTLNGQTFAVVFESLATNLTSTATVSGTGDLYSTGFTVAVPQLGSSTQLETPPDVTLNRKRVTITTQKFAVQSSGN